MSSEKNPQVIRINNKVFPWVLHPKDSNKKIAFVVINYRSALENLRLNNDFSIKIVQGAYKREKITIFYLIIKYSRRAKRTCNYAV